MHNAKFSWKGYWKPTPKLFRQLGDAMLATFSVAEIPAIWEGNKIMALTFLGLALGGKFLSNFFKDDPQQ